MKRLAVVSGVCVAGIGVGAGITFAVWTVGGSGSGGAAATVAQNLVVTAVTPTGAGATLYPGGPAGPVSMTIQNSNPFAVTVSVITWGNAVSNNTSSCPSSNISVDANAPTSVSISVPANTTTATQQVAGVLDLSHSAANGCQGVGFTVPVTATAFQQ